ncbi:MAG TPA: T9SS type A sorting domain-containing protein [Ignavibacteriaceae bacterium]|nr:T9SS type A sorting domain-containing protein [Ignavibacteriaceae bacterium]
MKIKTVIFSLALILFVSTSGFSQLKAIESFDYPVETSMDTLEADGGSGWASPWEHFDLNSEVMTVADSGFAYDDLNFQVPHIGNFIMGANAVAWGGQRYGRYLAQTWPNEAGKVYWLSSLYELRDFTTNGWALVSFYDSSAEKAGIGHEWGNDTIGVAVYNTAGHSSYTVHDGPQWLVASVYMSGDTLSNVYLWISPDPDGDEPDTNIADAKGRWNLVDGFNRVAVHFGGEGVGMVMAVDEIRLGESWADVSSPLTAAEGIKNELPTDYALYQNYPNPFNPTTIISYQLPVTGFVTLKVYDLLGREVATLVNKQESAGTYEHSFNASSLSSGIYIYKMQAGNFISTRKLMLIK